MRGTCPFVGIALLACGCADTAVSTHGDAAPDATPTDATPTDATPPDDAPNVTDAPPSDAGATVAFSASDPDGVCTLRELPLSSVCGATPMASCPVSVAASIDCMGDVDTVRVAAGPAQRAWVSFAVVPGNRTTRLVTIDPAGGSAIVAAPLGTVESIFAIANGAQVDLVGEGTATGLALGTPVGAGFTPEDVTVATPGATYYDGVADAQGDVYTVFGRADDTFVLASRTPDGTWQNVYTHPAIARGGVAISSDTGPLIAFWDGNLTSARLDVFLDAGAFVTASTSYPVNEGSIQIRVSLAMPPTSNLPVVASWTGAGPAILVPAGGAYTTVAPPAPTALDPSACSTPPLPCTAPATCTVHDAHVVPESLGVASAHGQVWAVYLWEQFDRDVRYAPSTGEGARCVQTTTADRSTMTLIVAAASDTHPRIVWQLPLTPYGGASIDALTARDDRLLIEVNRAQGPAQATAITYLDVDTTRLE